MKVFINCKCENACWDNAVNTKFTIFFNNNYKIWELLKLPIAIFRFFNEKKKIDQLNWSKTNQVYNLY